MGACFHHEEVVGRAGSDQIQAAVLHLGGRGVHHELTIHEADGDCGDGAAPGDVAHRQGCGRGDDSNGFHQVFAVGGQGADDDLGLIAHALGKERAQRAVDEPRNQDGLLAGTAFAAEEAAGDAPGGVEPLFELDGQGEEVNPLPHILAHGGGGQEDRVAVAHSDGAASLGREQTGLDAQRAPAHFCCEDVGSLKKLHSSFYLVMNDKNLPPRCALRLHGDARRRAKKDNRQAGQPGRVSFALLRASPCNPVVQRVDSFNPDRGRRRSAPCGNMGEVRNWRPKPKLVPLGCALQCRTPGRSRPAVRAGVSRTAAYAVTP